MFKSTKCLVAVLIAMAGCPAAALADQPSSITVTHQDISITHPIAVSSTK
jgi:hypothetical protein